MRKALIAALLLILPGLAHAECLGLNTPLKAFAFETKTVSTAAVGLTAATYSPTGGVQASVAVVTIVNPMRWSVASTPTAALGHLAADASSIKLCGIADIAAFLSIRSGGSDSVLTVTYYRPR